MKSSKKFLTRVLTAALALSMVAGTSVCAAAVEDTVVEDEPVIVIAPDDGEETPGYVARLDAIKAMLAEAAQNAYAKLSQTTIWQLAEVAKKIELSQQIMVDAASQISQIKSDTAEQAVMIMDEAYQLAAAVEDEEAAAQIIESAQQRVDLLVEEATQQTEQIMADAEKMSNELLAEATEQLEAIKAQLQAKASQKVAELMQKVAAVQQKIEEVKTQIKTAAAQKIAEIQEFNAKAIAYVIEKATKISYVSEGDFDYQIRSNIFGTYAVVIAYNGEDEEVTIPAYINDVPVEASMMYSEAEVKTVNVPATFKDINGLSFVSVNGLEAINVDEENPYFNSVDGVVFSENGTKLVAVPQAKEYNAPEGITSIGEFAYYMSQMSSVEIPSTVVYIGIWAFAGCENLEEVEIPYGVSYIGDCAFRYCINLKKAAVPSSVEKIYDDAFADVSDEFVMALETVSCQAYVYARENGIKYTCPLAASVSLETDAFVDDEEHFIAMLLGASLTITGEAEGGSDEGYKYAFYIRKEGDTKWSCKQGFKDNASITIKPEFTGNYEICLKVKDSAGTVAKMYSEIYVVNAFENTSTISSETIKKGESVTLYFGSNVDAPTSYAVYYKKTTDKKWTTKQDYTENEKVTVKPAKAADYIICVKAKNLNDGTISKKYFNVKVEA